MEGDFLVRHFSEDRVVLPHVDDLVDDLRDRFLRCQVCTQLYVTDQRCPKVLPCGHGLCSDCLEQASRPEGVRCQQCSPVRVVFGQPAPDRICVTLMDLISKLTAALDSGEEQTNPSVPDAAALFLTDFKEQLLTCNICEYAFNYLNHKLVTLSCQHELCSRCAKKMEKDKHECPFCRKAFHRRPDSTEDMLPAQLLKWLQPFLPALSSMTSNPADAFLDRLNSLHEVLEKHEDEIEEAYNRTNRLRSMRRVMFEALHDGQVSRLFPQYDQEVPIPDDIDSKCTNFANACVNIIRESLTAESVSTPEVWSILMSVLQKMTEQGLGNENICKAFLQAGALQPLIQDCWNPEFLKKLSSEKKTHLIESSWIVIRLILFSDEVKAEDNVLQMLVERVEVDGIEDGVALKSTDCLAFISNEQECKQKFADGLAKLQLPARFVQICRDAHAPETASSAVRKETTKRIYCVVQNFTYHSEAFSAAAIDAGILPLLVEACAHLENAPRQDEGDISGNALNIIENISRFPNLHHHLVEKGFVSLLMPCMKHENKGVAMTVASVLVQLCKSEEDIKSFQESFDKEGFLLMVKSWTESALTDSRRLFVYPGFPCVICPKDFLEFLCHVARFPGQSTKIVESGWLELLCRLMDEGKEEETRLVLDCLLTLSRSPDVGGRLAENKALLAKVRALQTEDTSPHSQASSLLLSRLQQQDKMAASQAGH